MQQFSFQNYRLIYEHLSSFLPLLDYLQINENTHKYLLLRHDVEFSVQRAYDLAKFEAEELNINSSYLFQIYNNAYNVFSIQNINLIEKISAMGHHIGLHVHNVGLDKLCDEALKEHILRDCQILSNLCKVKIDRFSYHRPSASILRRNIRIQNLINTYSPEYFHFFEDEKPEHLNVLYLADSNHTWHYGEPLSVMKGASNKVQLLTHPYSWTKYGANNRENFTEMTVEKIHELLLTYPTECKHFEISLERLKNEI